MMTIKPILLLLASALTLVTCQNSSSFQCYTGTFTTKDIPSSDLTGKETNCPINACSRATTESDATDVVGVVLSCAAATLSNNDDDCTSVDSGANEVETCTCHTSLCNNADSKYMSVFVLAMVLTAVIMHR